MQMTRKELDNLIGKTVMVEFRSGNVTRGKLGFTKEFSEKYGWRKPNYYTVDEYDFLISHIKNIKEVYAMTRKEAREVLQEEIDKYGQEYDDEGIEALEVAIKELEQEPILDKIRAEIMKLQTYKMFEGENTVYIERDDVLQIIDKYKAESVVV